MAEKTTRRLKLHLEEAKTGSSKDEGTASLATPTLYDVCCNNPTGVVIVGVVGYIVGSFLWKF
ncbi:hypothetical protein BU16DRAFT_526066 [Lophium mytilinum]|uniref:Uncharacterized protein n=1 Tax=Lophium mytilinum TaxID=390894 RepID=A0A6A6QX37_9PEZI|nr:hypothetical protein BU16DRAFT_526066 [Lophium mytilinum]